MPSIQQSQTSKVGRTGMTPIADPIVAPSGADTIIPPAYTQMSSFMHCSMPVIASTYDSISRQFYGNSRVPVTRILPPKVKR